MTNLAAIAAANMVIVPIFSVSSGEYARLRRSALSKDERAVKDETRRKHKLKRQRKTKALRAGR